jgi:hypothetical protein
MLHSRFTVLADMPSRSAAAQRSTREEAQLSLMLCRGSSFASRSRPVQMVPPSMQKPLATGITGWRRATASEPCRPGGYYAALPKAHRPFPQLAFASRALIHSTSALD